MPFPSNLEAMLSAGYEYVRAETCRDCGLEVEVYLTPGKRELAMEPMCGNESLAVRHIEVCNPLPASKDELLKVGYTLAKRIPCPVCNRAIEEYSHASRETLFLNPMMGGDWPVVPHRCNIAPKQGEKDGRGNQRTIDNPRTSGANQDSTGRVCDGGTEWRLGGAATGMARVHEQGQAGTLQPQRSPVLQDGRRDDAGAIKLHAVRDPNSQLLAVGWDDGTLVCQFKTAKWAYEVVPEAEFHKLTRSPFAYRIFTTNIKGKFPGTKLG